jgi:hypothetical protein
MRQDRSLRLARRSPVRWAKLSCWLPCVLRGQVRPSGPASADNATGQDPKSKNAGSLILVELGDSDGIATKEILDHTVWKIALLKVHHLRRKPSCWLSAMKSASAVITVYTCSFAQSQVLRSPA